MKGLVLAGLNDIEVRTDLPDPRMEAAGDAILAVRMAGICGSDLHPYEGREPVAWGIIPGHEAAGEVVEVGSAVERFRPGDRVCLPFTTSCGNCRECLSGLSSRCVHGQLFGWAPPDSDPASGLAGAQAEYVRVPLADATLIPLAPDQDFADGVLLGDNFATGFYCASRGDIGDAAAAVVIGCGAVGLSALVAARHLGAGRLIAIDPVESRREAAVRLGADEVLEPGVAAEADLRATTVLEAVGSRSARRLALTLARPGATISSVGVSTDEFGFRPSDLYDHNLTWRAGRCPARSIQEDIRAALASGLRIPTAELAPGPPLPLSQGPDAYRGFAARAGPGLKPLLAPGGDEGQMSRETA